MYLDDGTTESAKVTMNSFRFSTGGGRFSGRDFHPTEVFAGPPRDSFKPYYPQNLYERTQWDFSSETPLPALTPDRFAVQIPEATIDGERLSFPIVTFHRRELSYRVLCPK